MRISSRVRGILGGRVVLPFVLATGALLALNTSAAQEALVIPRLNGPIKLDGVIDEPAWETAARLSVTMNTPTFGGAPTERTELLIGYTDQYLYVAGRMYDSDPAGIQGPALNRDHLSTSSDWLAIVLDSFNDKEHALLFATTPTGLRTDYEISDDARGPNNLSWNTFWDVAVTKDHSGWFAEFRIPFSSLRFQDDHGRVVMGLIIWRYIARKNEVGIFPAIPPLWGFLGSINKPSKAREVVFEGIRRSNPLYVTPYVLGGLGQTSQLNGPGTGYQLSDKTVREVGLDLKYSATSNLTLDVTANTDFAQVEADNQQVNLTRFSLFFPEKRQFFQERSSLFDFNTGGVDRLFYSRRIGLAGDRPIRIYGGARLVGRVGEWDVGALDMQTAPDVHLASQNSGVLRLRRRVFNNYSYLGGMLTTRFGDDGKYNVAYGFDGILRPFGNDYVTFEWAQTFVDTVRADLFRSALMRVRWERRTVAGPGYDFSVTRSGEDYRPGLGFVSRTGFLQVGDSLFYGWMAEKKSSVFRQMLALVGSAFLRNDDGTVESSEAGASWSLDTKSGARVSLRGTRISDRPRAGFALSDKVTVPAGSYAFYQLVGTYRWPWGGLVTGDVSGQAGSFYDGSRFTVGVSPTWHLSRHLELGSQYQYNLVDFSDRNQHLRAHIALVRAQAMFSTRLTASTFVQYNSAIDGVIANVRIRFNPREGNDVYLVYNHRLNTDRGRLDPILPLTDSRTILLKCSYTFLSPLW